VRMYRDLCILIVGLMLCAVMWQEGSGPAESPTLTFHQDPTGPSGSYVPFRDQSPLSLGPQGFALGSVSMKLVGANPEAPAEGLEPTGTRVNFLRGSDPSLLRAFALRW